MRRDASLEVLAISRPEAAEDYNYSRFGPRALVKETANTLRARGPAPGELAVGAGELELMCAGELKPMRAAPRSRRPAGKAALLALAALTLGAAELEAQQRPRAAEPVNWASFYGGGYIDPSAVRDPETGVWVFGSGPLLGAGLHRALARSITVGVDGSLARLPVELESLAGRVRRDATLLHLAGSVALRTGSIDVISFYLHGSAGVLVYGMPEPVDRWDPDLAFRTGAGLVYRPLRSFGVFFDWGRFWAFHQTEGVRSETARHNQIRIGIQTGW